MYMCVCVGGAGGAGGCGGGLYLSKPVCRLHLCTVAAVLGLVTASPHVQNIHCINSRAVSKGGGGAAWLLDSFPQTGFQRLDLFLNSRTAKCKTYFIGLIGKELRRVEQSTD